MPLSMPAPVTSALPRNSDGLLATFYGDDFTGSTDVMEACVRSGLHTALFLDVPSREEVSVYGHLDVVGVAGISRSWSTTDMDNALPTIFDGVKRLGAPLFHYKICSTFDSAPHIGSIGRALELAREAFGPQPVPVVVGAPILKRYTAFGNLFATAGGVTHRIDRHPTMAHHPVTPMTESDLRVHLSRQTQLPGALVDVLALKGPADDVDDIVDAELSENPGYLLFDVLDTQSQRQTGRQLARLVNSRWSDGEATTVVIGSSGVEYALAHVWESGEGQPESASPDFATPPAAPTLVVVGSRSPVTEAQTAYALQSGFAEVPVSPAKFLGDSADVAHYRSILVEQISALVHSGTNTVVTTPAKSDDVPIDGNVLGQQLGLVLRGVFDTSVPQRLVVAGGDTSGHVARAIGIHSLTVTTLMAPGAPLCRAVRSGTGGQEFDVCLKGGQVGPVDYFVRLAGAGTVLPPSFTTQERKGK